MRRCAYHFMPIIASKIARRIEDKTIPQTIATITAELSLSQPPLLLITFLPLSFSFLPPLPAVY